MKLKKYYMGSTCDPTIVIETDRVILSHSLKQELKECMDNNFEVGETFTMYEVTFKAIKKYKICLKTEEI